MSQGKYWFGIAAMLFLGVLFVVSGVGKIFLQSTSVDYPLILSFLPASVAQAIFAALPYVETGIGLLLIIGVGVRFAASIAALLITAFMATNITLIALGRGAEFCSCFGINGRLTVSASLAMDIAMAIPVIIIFVCYRGNFFNTTPLILTEGHSTRTRLNSACEG